VNVSSHMRPVIILASVALCLSCAHVWAADDVPLPPDKWPVTLAEAVADITAGMSEQDKQLLRATKKEDLIQFHHGWGTGIRNGFGLWRGNDKLIRSACGKPCHPDDASMVIIEAVWTAVQK
jgi:hypothetical protein